MIGIEQRSTCRFSRLWLCALAFALTAAGAETLTVQVVGVTDGDTLTVLTADKRQVKVRLTGIDAPEKRQPYGEAAKQRLSDLAFGHDALIQSDKLDRYGRTLGKVLIDGRDVNLEMIASGVAWWFRRYAIEQPVEDQVAYEAAETAAREAKLGLWVDDDPVPPWEWRRQ